MGFKEESSFDKRRQLSIKIRNQYPHKIPVIVEAFKEKGSLLKLTNTKYLITDTESIHKLLYEVRKKIDMLREDEALFLFCNTEKGDILAPVSSTIGQIYEKHADQDGFLYFTVTREQVFG
jgi:GABA(A) receptor-associated protein